MIQACPCLELTNSIRVKLLILVDWTFSFFLLFFIVFHSIGITEEFSDDGSFINLTYPWNVGYVLSNRHFNLHKKSQSAHICLQHKESARLLPGVSSCPVDASFVYVSKAEDLLLSLLSQQWVSGEVFCSGLGFLWVSVSEKTDAPKDYSSTLQRWLFQ